MYHDEEKVNNITSACSSRTRGASWDTRQHFASSFTCDKIITTASYIDTRDWSILQTGGWG